jgi:hypothetical protein
MVSINNKLCELGPTEEDMKELGRMENNMVLRNIFSLMELLKSDCGRTGSD